MSKADLKNIHDLIDALDNAHFIQITDNEGRQTYSAEECKALAKELAEWVGEAQSR